MATKTYFDKQTKKMTRVETWETVDDDGVVNHHQAVAEMTYNGQAYVRLFYKPFALAVKNVSKAEHNALLYIFEHMAHNTNIVSMNYSDLEKYLDLNNPSVNRVMQELQRRDIVRCKRHNEWMFNPSLGVACYDNQIPGLLQEYYSIPSYEEKQRERTERKEAKKNVVESNHGENAEITSNRRSDVYSEPHESEDEALY